MLIACWDCQPEKTNTPSPFCLWHDRHGSNEKGADRSRRYHCGQSARSIEKLVSRSP